MRILRVFNNNVVLARNDSGGEVILTGRGLGYQTKPGDAVRRELIVRAFEPTDGRDPDHTAALLAAIPAAFLHLAEDALADLGTWSGNTLPGVSNPATLVALADHLAFAVERAAQGMVVAHPLGSEIEHLYPAEYRAAGHLLDFVNARLDRHLGRDEVVPVAMHLVNASLAGGDMSGTYAMTGILQQIFEVLESAYGRTFDTRDINAARFVTHLRYLFVRIDADRQLHDEPRPVVEAFLTAYPRAARAAARLATVLELRLGTPVSADEVAYLTMHVARLTGE